MMKNGENVYKEVYVVFDLNENMYVKYLNLYEENAYTLKPFLAQEFRTEFDAITECKEQPRVRCPEQGDRIAETGHPVV